MMIWITSFQGCYEDDDIDFCDNDMIIVVVITVLKYDVFEK